MHYSISCSDGLAGTLILMKRLRPHCLYSGEHLGLEMRTRNDYRVVLVWAALIGLAIAALWFKVPLG